MRKRLIIISLSILIVFGLIILITNDIKKVYIDIDGVRYAITVNGESATSFPSGNYKVGVDCTNAYGYWDSITNKVIIKNIKGNISCDIDFTSITNSDYLNTYLLGLSGTTQGDGQLVHETGEIPDYTNSTVVKSFGTTPVYFRNSSSTSTTQTQVDSFWTFNSSTGVFTSVPSKMTTSGLTALYHAYMKVPSAGYYRICYTIAQALNANNFLYIAKSTTQLAYITPSTSAAIAETCFDMGYFESTDYFNISERGYNGTSSPVMTFRIEKSETVAINDTGYRFEGSNPNNYVMFNNELWRIIGVFSTEYDSNNGGTANTTDNLVKIIRDDSIGALVWDKSNTNDWPNSSLYHLLNEQYYDWETNKSNVSDNCYQSGSDLPGQCDYSIIGIKDGYRSMIANAKWYLGGGGKSGYTTYTPGSIYIYERDANAIYTGRSASTLGYIGLMYESDYLYGVLASNCVRTTAHDSYNRANCAGKDWLYGKGHERTVSPVSSTSNNVWNLNNVGIVGSYSVIEGHGVRPVLYLSSSVYKVSGTGTIIDPYIIGMAS